MKTEHFDAILDKNEIARVIKNYKNELKKINFPINYIIERLKGIETFLGGTNQPSVDDILNSVDFNI